MRATITLTPKQLALAVGAVAAGGAVGTLLRDLSLRVDSTHWYETSFGVIARGGHVSWWGQIPWILLLINLIGVFFATRLLVGPLKNHDPNNLTRLLIITGFFGGFTSYSSLFVSLAAIWHVSIVASVGVCVGALVSGVAAGWLGSKVNRP
jgi:fluoride ion exporter CrcB/FEX